MLVGSSLTCRDVYAHTGSGPLTRCRRLRSVPAFLGWNIPDRFGLRREIQFDPRSEGGLHLLFFLVGEDRLDRTIASAEPTGGVAVQTLAFRRPPSPLWQSTHVLPLESGASSWRTQITACMRGCIKRKRSYQATENNRRFAPRPRSTGRRTPQTFGLPRDRSLYRRVPALRSLMRSRNTFRRFIRAHPLPRQLHCYLKLLRFPSENPFAFR